MLYACMVEILVWIKSSIERTGGYPLGRALGITPDDFTFHDRLIKNPMNRINAPLMYG